MSCRLGAVALVFGLASVALTPAAHAERPRSVIVEQEVELKELTPGAVIPYNKVYLNRCPSGCTVKPGPSNSIADSWGISSTRTLTSFPYGDTAWNEVVKCVKDVMSPFVIEVTDVSPGSAKHFEIMVAGLATDLGMSSSIGGVAPGSGSCSGYVDNALVFAFAKSYGNNTSNTCDARCVDELCSTAAQEIGHVWKRMDHVREASDPMTYFGYSARRYFQNTSAQCGSDCVDGFGPQGETCSGTNTQSHTCVCGGQTQNSYNVVKELFGLGPGTPPMVTITSPKIGEQVKPGFAVVSNPTDDSGNVVKVDLKVDGQIVSTLSKGPFVFNAPDTLGNGTHKVEVIAYDPHQTPGSAMVDVVIGPPCHDEGDCSKETDVCVGGRCVPGSGVNGGLGSTCTQSIDCLSNQCASDGESMYCVEQCMVGQCPSEFGCLETGPDMGVCWPGYDDGSGGCCQSSRSSKGSALLGFAVLVLVCRRRRR
jgi:hypothetical protein